MRRIMMVLLLAGFLAHGDEEPAAKKRLLLKSTMRAGQRYTGKNTVSFKIKTTIRQGGKVSSSSESVERNERFVDTVRRAGANGVLEIERNYLRLFTKTRAGENERPTVHRSPLSGRTVGIHEKNRRRDIRLKGRGAVGSLVRRTAGLEMDWRDIFPDDPVGPGDAWDADATALARRLSAYLNCGNRTRMRVRFEEILQREGAELAKLYVDWTMEGMRDRHLFTKVQLAGYVHFDLELKRVVHVDLVGTMVVRGAIIGSGQPRIIKGEGPVSLKSSLKAAPVEASAPG